MANGDVVVTLLGSGDAFGSGGRLQTCFLAKCDHGAVLIDCGATVCIAMKRNGVTPESVDAVLITHFHADHFAGLPFLLIEARLRNRGRPLIVAGPAGIEERTRAAMDVLFPGANSVFTFPVVYVEYQANQPMQVGPATVTATPVAHVPLTNPHALRLEMDGRTIAYSGDTKWTDVLFDVARGAHLFLCEVNHMGGTPGIHLDAASLLANRSRLACKRLVITHMGTDVLQAGPALAAELDATLAEDGLTLHI